MRKSTTQKVVSEPWKLRAAGCKLNLQSPGKTRQTFIEFDLLK